MSIKFRSCEKIKKRIWLSPSSNWEWLSEALSTRTNKEVFKLSDFLALELYYGNDAAAQFFEELTQKYDQQTVLEALEHGDLNSRKIEIGPARGRLLCWLSDQARSRLYAAAQNWYTTHR